MKIWTPWKKEYDSQQKREVMAFFSEFKYALGVTASRLYEYEEKINSPETFPKLSETLGRNLYSEIMMITRVLLENKDDLHDLHYISDLFQQRYSLNVDYYSERFYTGGDGMRIDIAKKDLEHPDYILKFGADIERNFAIFEITSPIDNKMQLGIPFKDSI